MIYHRQTRKARTETNTIRTQYQDGQGSGRRHPGTAARNSFDSPGRESFQAAAPGHISTAHIPAPALSAAHAARHKGEMRGDLYACPVLPWHRLPCLPCCPWPVPIGRPLPPGREIFPGNAARGVSSAALHRTSCPACCKSSHRCHNIGARCTRCMLPGRKKKNAAIHTPDLLPNGRPLPPGRALAALYHYPPFPLYRAFCPLLYDLSTNHQKPYIDAMTRKDAPRKRPSSFQ